MSPATMSKAIEGKFISTVEAARRLGLTSDQLARLIRTGAVTVRKLPGVRAKILEADVARLETSSIIPASK